MLSGEHPLVSVSGLNKGPDVTGSIERRLVGVVFDADADCFVSIGIAYCGVSGGDKNPAKR